MTTLSLSTRLAIRPSFTQLSPSTLEKGAGVKNLLKPGSWISSSSGSASASENPLGTLNVAGDGTNRGVEEQQVTGLSIGEEYTLVATIATGSVIMRVGTSQGGQQVVAGATYAVGTLSVTFVATASSVWVRFERLNVGSSIISAISLTRVQQSPLRVSANRGKWPVTTFVTVSTNVRAETRKLYKIGGADLSQIVLAWTGLQAGQTNVEQTIGNDQLLQAAIEIPTAPTPVVRVLFKGANSGTITNGQNIILSDKVLPSAFGLAKFDKNTQFYVREERNVTVGQRLSADLAVNNLTGESTQYSDGLSASQLMSSGALSTPSGGSSSARRHGPTAVLGRAIGAADTSVVIIGDSIPSGNNDTDALEGNDGSNGGGFVLRGLYNSGGRTVPDLMLAIPGSKAVDFVANMTNRSVWMAFCSDLLENYGTNDFSGSSRTADQVYADRQTIWSAAKSAGVSRITALPILIRTTSSNGFVDAAGQTVRSGYENGGAFREVLNGYLFTGEANGLINRIIDLNSVAADPSATDKFASNGTANYATSDGTHPSPAMSALLGPLVAAAYAA